MAAKQCLKTLAGLRSSPIRLSSSRGIATTQQKDGLFTPSARQGAGHSQLLADRPDLYELFVEDVRPVKWDDYLKQKAVTMQMLAANPDNKGELVASWTFVAGSYNFRAMHLIRFPMGWQDLNDSVKAVKADTKLQEVLKSEREYLNRQQTEYFKSFSFWPQPTPRTGGHIYDLRSYLIKPGSMYDWSYYWARGLPCRQSVREDIPYGGFFSQLGQIHNISHIWVYKDYADRKSCRDGTWNQAEWNEVVAKTVPLIRGMRSRILEPLPFSPTQ